MIKFCKVEPYPRFSTVTGRYSINYWNRINCYNYISSCYFKSKV